MNSNFTNKVITATKVPSKYPHIGVIREEDDEDIKQSSSISSTSVIITNPDSLDDIELHNKLPNSPPSQKYSKEEDPLSRTKWDSQWEFIMSCMSMCIGLGNVWRFPVTVYKNGGGAFLIPYVIVVLLIGRPIFFLELSLGQFTSRNQVQVWRCVPFFKGVGLGTMVGAMCALTFYCSLLSLPVYYFLRCFENPLPWTECKESWAGLGNCNGTRLNMTSTNQSLIAEMFFRKEVLKEYPNIKNGIGSPDWKLTLCLIFSWVVIYFTILKGVKSFGKVAYVTAIFPYIVLLILLIHSVITLPGAWVGIRYFIEPNWNKIFEPSVWYEAAVQCFFSLSTGLGPIIMFASYNPLHYNIYRDSLIFTLADTGTSLLSGFITFAILGDLSHELGVSIESVMGNGDFSLAFVSYPIYIAKIGSEKWFIAAIFFLMLFILGVGSAIADALAVSIVFCDRYPHFREWVVTLFICIICCAIGLVYVTPGGQYILTLVDFFAGAFCQLTMSTLQVIGVAWCYGLYNFIGDIEFLLGIKLGWFWKICYGVIIPFFLVFVLIYSLINERLEYNGQPFPASAKACGWLLAVAGIGCFVAGAFHAMRQVSAVSWIDKLKLSMRPKYGWGPRNSKDREDWQIFISKQDRRSFRRRLRDNFIRLSDLLSNTTR